MNKTTKKTQVKKGPLTSMPVGMEVTPELLLKKPKSRLWETAASVYAFAILILFPLFMLNITNRLTSDGSYKFFLFDNYWYSNLTDVKTVTFRVLTIAFLVACVVLLFVCFCDENVLRNRRELKIPGEKPLFSLPQILLMSYLLWQIVCAFAAKGYEFNVLWVGTRRYESMNGIRTEGLYHIFLYGVAFLLISFFGEYSKRYLRGLAVSALIFSAPAIAQLFGINLFYPSGIIYWDSLFLSTLGNIDCVGGYAATVVPLLFAGYVLVREKKWRYTCLVSASLLLLVLLYADVDSGKVGLALAALALFPLLLDRKERVVRTLRGLAVLCVVLAFSSAVRPGRDGIGFAFGKVALLMLVLVALLGGGAYLLDRFVRFPEWSPAKMRKILTLSLAVLIVAGMVFLFFYQGGNPLLFEAHELLHFRLSDDAGSGRGHAWKACFTMIGESPIFGKGPGTFTYEYNPRFLVGGAMYDLAHNDFLQIGVHSGLVGLALYVAFLVLLAIRAYRAAGRCPAVIPLIGACAGYLGHIFFSFSIAFVTPLFWVIAGILEKTIRQMPTEEDFSEK